MKKKILIISPIPTHPQNAGHRQRIFQIARTLSRMNCEVYFIYLRDLKQAMTDDMNGMRKYWSDRLFVLSYASHKNTGLQSVSKVTLDDWYESHYDDEIKDIALQVNPNIVWVEYAAISKVFHCFDASVLKILDTHDCFTDWNAKLSDQGIDPPQWYSFTEEEETKALDRADIVLAVSKYEKNLFSEMTQKKVIEIGHFLELKNSSFKQSKKESIVFVGSKSAIVKNNIDYFLEEIFPKVQACVSNVKLTIVGTICDLLGEVPDGVTLAGYIENLEPVYDAARVVINADQFGTGISIKSLTALGHAKPLVTTAIGARGIEDGSDTAFLLRNSPEEFAQGVIDLLTNDYKARALAEEAYRYAREYKEKQMVALKNVLENQTLLKKEK